jgi:tyrosinase
MFDARRRTFLNGSAGFTLAALMPAARAQARVVTRPASHTAAGQEMLMIYAKAVGAMMDPSKYPEGDPRSWTFQWYTHMVRGDRTKNAELQRIYGANGTHRELAKLMWNTCEAHLDASREPFFLPWHRLYLLAFEDIVRVVSGRADFALPYWDYTDPDPNRRALPEAFRSPNHPILKHLFRPNRNPGVNQGQPIDQPAGSRAPLSLDFMKSVDYNEFEDDAGFCANIDGTLHGAVHVNVGNQIGMGRVAWAADDPIFWVHHCNIDRAWASWNRAGGVNPTAPQFLNEEFTFASPTGEPLRRKAGETVQMQGYLYDFYIGADPIPATRPLLVANREVARASARDIGLSTATRQVKLASAATQVGDRPSLVAAPPKIDPDNPAYLKLEGLSADSGAPAYDVHVTAVSSVTKRRSAPSYVGTINFFGADSAHSDHGEGHGGSHSAGHIGGQDEGSAASGVAGRSVSFQLGKVLKQLLSQSEQAPYITFVPLAGGAKDAKPRIRRILVSGS